ncbi:MAG: TonB-dependent receptor, partial [Flaviaesturariibacter sp.]|nr:TonB-dependent receptor [Flaviaesturariibacter sp.]
MPTGVAALKFSPYRSPGIPLILSIKKPFSLTRRFLLLLLGQLCCLLLFAQQKTAAIAGHVLDGNGNNLAGVSVVILGQQRGITTSDSGTFHLVVPADKAFALLFSHAGYRTVQQNFMLNAGESELVTITLETGAGTLQEVVVTDSRERTEIGLLKPNPKSVINLPSPTGGVEGLIKVFVGSNNELTSQYNVRGGSYDENLIYVNDFEIFRPYLVRSGQQEGLSFINPALVRNINFYNGGFGARYGDKMSSVLDIQYNRPRTFGGSAYVGILEQGFHVEGVTAKKKFTYLLGARNRSNRNLLSRQETEGIYIPSSADLQGLFNYQVTPKASVEALLNFSSTRFTLVPAFSQLTSSVFSPFYTASLGVDIFFEGQEKDAYDTRMVGLSTTIQPRRDLRMKFLASRFQNVESENRDITGAYLFGDRDFEGSSATFGKIINPLGAGINQDFARNAL